MSSNPHPARSLDFLSRLHDGELSPAERAHFESHRAHCDDCRRAAAEFENALAVYRTAGTSPPPSDLAARILRRLESSNRRRSPFGVVFGIDLRWAGAFTAALVAVIFGYSVLDRREAPRRIPISFAPPPAPSASASLPSQATSASQEPLARPLAKAVPQANVAAMPASVAPRPAARPSPAAATDRLASVAAEQNSRADDSVSPAKAARAPARAKEEDPGASRVIVTALDGAGAPPSLLNGPAVAFRPGDRGQYVLVVGADGVPVEVDRLEDARKEKKGDLDQSASDVVRKLRFQPAAGPRRLLVKVESVP